MAKRCSICEKEEATLMVKDSNNYYCKECADENFDDISFLQTVEEQAQKLKKLIEEKTNDPDR